MKLFAVSSISFYNNEMDIQFFQANDWKEAAAQHEDIGAEFLEPFETLEEAQEAAFDGEFLFTVLEVPGGLGELD